MSKYRLQKKDQFVAYEAKPSLSWENGPAAALLSYLGRKRGLTDDTKSVTLAKKVTTYTQNTIPIELVKEMEECRVKFSSIVNIEWYRLHDEKPINCLDWSFFIQTTLYCSVPSEELSMIRKSYDNHDSISLIVGKRLSFVHIVTKDVASLAKVKLILSGNYKVTDITEMKNVAGKVNSLNTN